MPDLYNGYEPVTSVPPDPPVGPFTGVAVGADLTSFEEFLQFEVQQEVDSSFPDVFLNVAAYIVVNRGPQGEQWTTNGVNGVVQLQDNDLVEIPLGAKSPVVLPKTKFIRPASDTQIVFVTTFRQTNGTVREGSLITVSRAVVKT